jgi:glutathione S-transferase
VTDEVVFYTNPRTRGRIVRWMLQEIGQPYRTELLDLGTSSKSAAYLAINPMGKVPAIRHRGVIVTETAAICTYLADAFPQAGLAPAADDPLRGSYYRWLFFAAGPFESAVTNKSLGFETPPGREVMAGWGTFAAVMHTMESALTPGPYILGNRFSAADVYIGSQIGFGLMFNSIEKRPAFERYWQGISSRPAAIKAREIDDALIAKASASK